MNNEFEVRGEVTAIFLDSPKYGRIETLISTDKLGKAQEFPNRWHVSWHKDIDSFYVVGHTPKIKGKFKTILLHRWVTNAPKNMSVDHLNHDTLNNTNSNLSVITQKENMMNRKGATKTNISGFRGVHWAGTINRWYAQKTVNGKRHYVGVYVNLEDAINAYNEFTT